MADALPDGRVPRRIANVYEAGSADDGQDLRLNIQFEDGSFEWFDLRHDRAGQFIAGIQFAAQVAARERPKTSSSGQPLPDLATLVDVQSVQANALPGHDFVALRIMIAPDVPLVFRIPLHRLPAIQAGLDAAERLARSGIPPMKQ